MNHEKLIAALRGEDGDLFAKEAADVIEQQFTANDMATARAEGFRDGVASLPVGVPEGWKPVPIKPTIEMVEAGYEEGIGMPDRSAHARVIEQYDAMLAAAPTVKNSLSVAAPSAPAAEPEPVATAVKAEQVDDRAECIADGLSVGMSQEEAEEFADKIAIPSLPTAVVEEVEVVAWTWQGTLDRLKQGNCPEGEAVWPSRSPGTTVALMTVAQHQRILSAVTAERDAMQQDLKNAFNDDLKMAALREQEGEIKQLRAGVEASRLLLEQCNEVIAEDGGVYIELRAFLAGTMPAADVIALLRNAAMTAKEGGE